MELVVDRLKRCNNRFMISLVYDLRNLFYLEIVVYHRCGKCF